MNNSTSCNVSSLDIFIPSADNQWDTAKVKHLHNRLGFGIKPSLIPNALATTPSSYVDQIIDNAMALAPTVAPSWVALDPDDYEANGLTYNEDENKLLVHETQYTFIKDLLDNGIRGRLTLFWHNHFVTRVIDYEFAGYAFRYFLLLQQNSFGNFKDFVSKIGLDGAMLKFLNGFENTKESPNENYARELYELFTLGEGNGYTEADIVETSRALTGYNDYANGENSTIIYNADNFDTDEKTIFGQTGNWNYDDVITIVFEQKTELISRYICERMYVNFVSPEVDEAIKTSIINPLADIFIANDFEIAPVLKALFKSEHFYDKKAQSTIIKSPLDLIVEFMTSTGFNYGDYDMNKESIYNVASAFDQTILLPPTVFGWPGDRNWINSGTITFRQSYLCKDVLLWAWEQDQEQFRELAVNVSNNSTNAEEVALAIFETLMIERPYTEDDFKNGLDIFKSRVPSNYFEDNIWSLSFETAPLQVKDLIEYIVSLPDYQLK